MTAGERVYRGSVGLLARVAASAVLGVAGVPVLLATATSVAVPVWLAVSAATIALAGVLVVRVWHSGTRIDADRIVVRGLWSTRTLAWSDVHEIRIELNPGAFVAAAAPVEVVLVYLRNARTLILPHLNQANLDRFQLDLSTEVEAIRNTWIRRRGSGWTPTPRVLAKVAERARYGVASWAIGVLAAVAGLGIMMVVFLVGVFTDAWERPPALLSWLIDPLSALIVPVTAFAAGTAISHVRRRRQGRSDRSHQ